MHEKGTPTLELNDLMIFFSVLHSYSARELPVEGGKVTGLFCPLLFEVE